MSNAVPDTFKERPESPKRPEKATAVHAQVEPPTTCTPTEEKEEELDHRKSQLERQLSQMSYPKIGPGYSDTISVVSDLSTPTVMTDWEIPEEEHYGPPLQIGIRQPSVGSTQMVRLPPDHDESSRCLEQGKQVRPRSQRVVAPPPPQRRGAVAQRLQNRQAVLAHLDQAATAAAAAAAAAETGHANDRTKHTTPKGATETLTVNDFSSLNYPTDEPSEYAAVRKNKTIHNHGRRNLLRKSNKYAASVTANSTRMLLQSNARSNNRGGGEPTTCLEIPVALPPLPPKHQVDVDGVLSTMNCDIDFLFQELSVLDNAPFAQDLGDDEESNIGSTAKIKYTLGSVARTLFNDAGASPNRKQNVALHHDHNSPLGVAPRNVWSDGTIKEEQLSSSSAAASRVDPLLIDEDGFIVSNNDTSSGDFVDPFAPNNNNNNNKQEDLFAPKATVNPFANSFFPAPKNDTKRRVKRRPTAESSSSQQVDRVVEAPNTTTATTTTATTIMSFSDSSRESRIDAVEMATKKRIEMLRKLVEYRARTTPTTTTSEDSGSKDELQKLDFVEAETMKQIARLRDGLGESRRQFGGV
jgi:hypothetical protein